MKKIKQNIVQINNNELQKCKLGQEFKVDVITQVKSKPTPPVPPNGGNGGGRGGNVVRKPRKAPDWFQAFQKTNTILLEEILKRLGKVEKDVSGIDTRLNTVIKLNNLKTE
jgi:hypothetical protein